jgi:hypothetical protein
VAGCSEPGTSTDPKPVLANQIVEADASPGVRTRFVFETAAEGFSVYFQTTTGSVTIAVKLNGAELVRRTDATASSDGLEHHLVGQVNVSSPAQFDVEVTGSGHARFQLVELPPTPSARSAALGAFASVRPKAFAPFAPWR